MLKIFGANELLGCSVEIYGEEADNLTLDERITISSMATELGSIAIFFPPSETVISYCASRSKKKFEPVYADSDAVYSRLIDLDISTFEQSVSLPGNPENVELVKKL